MAKTGVAQLVKSLAAEGSGLPKGAKVTAILPYVNLKIIYIYILYYLNKSLQITNLI